MASIALLFVLIELSFAAGVNLLSKRQLGARIAIVVFQGFVYLHLESVVLGLCANSISLTTFAGYAGIHWLSLAEMLLVSRVDVDEISSLPEVAGSKAQRQASGLDLVWQAICLSFNLRRIGTKWDPRKIATHHQTNGSRTAFVVRNLGFVLSSYLLLDALSMAPLPEARLTTPEKQAVISFWKLSMEDFFFRLVFTLSYWATTYIVMAAMVRAAAIVVVALGLSAVKSWPALNGPLSSATSLRAFWGIFWHQCWRKSLLGFADTITFNFFGLCRGTVPSRYLRLSVVFLLSGLVHTRQDLILQITWHQSGSLSFFLMQAAGIMLEDAVGAIASQYPLSSRLQKSIGIIWMGTFLCLTTPTWAFPKLRAENPPSQLPLSLLKLAVNG